MKTKRVILIDDDEDEFLLLRQAFQHQAPELDLCWFDSPQAFVDSQIWRQPIHLFVFDLMINQAPLHWQATIRRQVGLQHVPMVIHSGSESPGDRQKMTDAGAADFLLKAATSSETSQLVDRLVQLAA